MGESCGQRALKEKGQLFSYACRGDVIFSIFLIDIRTKRYYLNWIAAGWSSLVARRAHNPKVVGSNPAPATTTNTRAYVNFVSPFFVTCFSVSNLISNRTEKTALTIPGNRLSHPCILSSTMRTSNLMCQRNELTKGHDDG